MSTPTQEAPALPRLRCLGGAPPPPELAADLRRLLELPAGARQRLWEALGPSLAEPVPAAVERLLDEFCRRHEVDAEGLARVLKACRFLVREASKRDLDRAALATDLATLTPASVEEGEQIQAVLLAGYEKAKAVVRREILRGALLDHGKLLAGVDWRIDTISAASRGAKIEAPVVVLTLSYQEGGRSERITLQATPEMLRELQRACAQILG
ncbi:COMM domain-containing protein [Sorangium sp. So ce131]|uniref:COMM domain-containing protein n=1 Tax=Sorangium sp. So ce131 TaxID=3133282 RepID=UPI003F5E49D8